jgi:hypothetical protein
MVGASIGADHGLAAGGEGPSIRTLSPLRVERERNRAASPCHLRDGAAQGSAKRSPARAKPQPSPSAAAMAA